MILDVGPRLVLGTDVGLYLQAAIAQYMSSCCRHGVTVPAGLHLLALDVALLRGHSHQVRVYPPATILVTCNLSWQPALNAC